MTERWEQLMQDLPEKWVEFAEGLKTAFMSDDMVLVNEGQAECMAIGVITMSLSSERSELLQVEEAVNRYEFE